MKAIEKWFLFTGVLLVFATIAWYFQLGIWAAYSFAQFNIVLGQLGITSGIWVILYEIDKRWYIEES